MLRRGLRSSSQKAKSQRRLRKSPSRCFWHYASYFSPGFSAVVATSEHARPLLLSVMPRLCDIVVHLAERLPSRRAGRPNTSTFWNGGEGPSSVQLPFRVRPFFLCRLSAPGCLCPVPGSASALTGQEPTTATRDWLKFKNPEAPAVRRESGVPAIVGPQRSRAGERRRPRRAMGLHLFARQYRERM
jgi:hypothetical protein